tara:strand:- start:4056 stop:5276 length:1221 start_codon:yes stop_codon:yes gene_type:complete
MKKFEIPLSYSASIIDSVRKIREKKDPRKRDMSPSVIKMKNVEFHIGRHFGFCYGVKNAIEICYTAIKNFPNKKIYLLSEMIHNQLVNQDLLENGISFILDTSGNQLISWDKISENDIVIIPAFGTSLEVLEILKSKNIKTEKFDTTCPFVAKVWKRSKTIAKKGFTTIIYGKADHEETKSTFSRAKKHGPAIIVETIEDVYDLCEIIQNSGSIKTKKFENKISLNFNFNKDLIKVGVVNQTTMLASETKDIIEIITNTLRKLHNKDDVSEYIANTKDTLCYATNENQQSTLNLLKNEVDLAIIVGGYNSSNTTHLAELTSQKVKTYFINSPDKINLDNNIKHFDFHTKKEVTTKNFLPQKKCKIILTSGASCPDIIIEKIMRKISSIKKEKINLESILTDFEMNY